MTASLRSLVTGGAGFVGSHLVEALLRRGDAVTVVDDLSTGFEANLEQARHIGGTRLRFVKCTVSEAEQRTDMEAFDRVYHLAAAVGVRRVMQRPMDSLEVNVLETSAAIRMAQRTSARTVIASSSEVYGKSTRLPFRESDDVVYGPTSVTRWSYGCSKALDEFMALAAHRGSGLPVVVVRLFNTVGPRQVGRWGMVLPRFVEAARANRPLEVHGDGMQSRCFADVRDVVRGIERLLETDAALGGVFNIGSDRPIGIRALAEVVVRRAGSRSAIVSQTYEAAFGPGFEDLRAREPDLTRIRGLIGFDATIPLEQTIDDVITWLDAASRKEHAA
ncbi:MAG: NAD-dependent epimerase/dehydratase family protein [Planctomycetes bacterium]|nr:NAD-dependent epimerase/dehydratase family protein [Planctomycetota bacterium]